MIQPHPLSVKIRDDIILGNPELVVFAGPCSIESEDLVLSVAEKLKAISDALPISMVFKSSYDKANRTSVDSYRSVGIDRGLEILKRVKEDFGLPVITDVHETNQVDQVSEVADVIQIPAFLARQTSLLVKAGQSGCAVNIKKGQFMAPGDMKHAALKVSGGTQSNVFLTERGTTFGYGDLVVDFRSFEIMRSFAPVVHDVTHSIQQPGALDGSSGGQSWFAAPLARAAVAVGVDGLFIETHPNPSKALSDGPNMIALENLEKLLVDLLEIRSCT